VLRAIVIDKKKVVRNREKAVAVGNLGCSNVEKHEMGRLSESHVLFWSSVLWRLPS
jgi:hypothetical protein